jgi:hypothetical protein
VKKLQWIYAGNVLLFFGEIAMFVRLFTVHPSAEDRYHSAIQVAGQVFLGLLISVFALIFAALTRKSLKAQKWFALFSLVTTIGWGLLFLLASVAV